MLMKQGAQKYTGFTIVELLIVIVVIAILAAITIVAYTGISDRAKHSSAQTLTSQVARKIEAHAAEHNDQYPADLDTISVSDPADPRKYQYTANNGATPRTYCVTVTVQGISYYQNSTTARNPTVGSCPGHGVNGLPPNIAQNGSFETAAAETTTRTNLANNPSIETVTSGWGITNGGTGAAVASSPTRAHSGTRSLEYTYGDSTHQDSGPTGSVYVNANTPYTVSAWVYAPTAIGSGLRIIVHGTPIAGGTERGTASTTVNAWTRLSYTVTPSTAGTMSYTIAKTTSASNANQVIYVDSVLVESTPSLGDYFSGASAASGDFSYGWTGTAQVSTSIERAPSVANFVFNGSGGNRFQSDVRSSQGDKSARVLITTNAVNPGLYQNVPALAPGTYTLIAKVWIEPGLSSAVTTTIQGTGITLGNAGSYPVSTSTQGQWAEIRRTATFTTAASTNFFIYIGGNVNGMVGKSFWVDEFAIVEGTCTTERCY